MHGSSRGQSSGSSGGDDKLAKAVKDPILAAVKWVKQLNQQQKSLLGIAAAIVVSWHA